MYTCGYEFAGPLFPLKAHEILEVSPECPNFLRNLKVFKILLGDYSAQEGCRRMGRRMGWTEYPLRRRMGRRMGWTEYPLRKSIWSCKVYDEIYLVHFKLGFLWSNGLAPNKLVEGSFL